MLGDVTYIGPDSCVSHSRINEKESFDLKCIEIYHCQKNLD